MHTNILVSKTLDCSMKQTNVCCYEIYNGMKFLGSEMKKKRLINGMEIFSL